MPETTAFFAAGLPAPAYSYSEFRALVRTLAAEHRTSGPDQLPGLIRFTDQNQGHLDRAFAAPLLPALVEQLRTLANFEIWVMLGETWCGDTAHTLPVLERLAQASGGRVQLFVLLRSDHPAAMAAHQTNGKNSIPKLIRLDAATYRELGTWGPRPSAAQALSEQLHAEHTPTGQLVRLMNEWYTDDNGQSLQAELLALLG
jgi:hypothetical protein